MWKWSDLKRLLTRKSARLDTAELGAVMWPVVYPDMLPPKDPHITVVMFKDINNPDLGFTKEDVIAAVQAVPWEVFLWTRVTGLEWFGAEQNIPVLRVHHDYLPVFHQMIKTELAKRGIPVDETFPDYKPHVSITDEAALNGIYPKMLLAGPVEVWWGNEHYKIDADKDKQIMLNRDGKP